MNQTRNFNGYSLFDDVDDVTLQARNRATICRNIAEDIHEGAVKDYFNMIPQPEQLAVVTQLQQIAGVQ